MLDIKKYANGRFFDTNAKKYIKPEKLAEMVKKGEKIKVTLTETGKDITSKILAQFSKKELIKKDKKSKKQRKEIPFLKTDKLKQWLGDMIDSKIEQVMDIIKLPSRDQVAKLDKNIKELNDKIDALKLAQEKSAPKKAAPRKAAPKKAAPKKAVAPKQTVTKDAKPVQTKTEAVKTEEKK